MQQISSSGQQQKPRGSGSGTGGHTSGGGISDSDAGKLVVNLNSTEREAIIKQNGFRNAVDVTRKLNEIKNERKILRS